MPTTPPPERLPSLRPAPDPSRPHSVDHLAGRPVWSESVALTYLSDDGGFGFDVRLCRYPDVDSVWVWLAVHRGEQTWSYDDNYLPGTRGRQELESGAVHYATGEGAPTVRFERVGSFRSLRSATLVADVLAHRGGEVPQGEGDVSVHIAAELRPLHDVQRAAGGRNEVFGELSAEVRVGSEETEVSGIGKWHEQHQEAPRWTVPFTYLAVAGGEASLLAVRSPARTYGFLRRGGQVRRVTGFEIDGPAADRAFHVELEDGRAASGSAHRLRSWSVPIYTDRRPATHVEVSLDGDRLLGSLNDYVPGWATPGQEDGAP